MQAAANSRMGVEGDELIVSGDGAGCWDDEDCSAFTTDQAASDDLITPRLVMVSPRPPYNPVQPGFRTSTARPRSPASTCSDDEDCLEGSGDGSNGDDDDDEEEEDRRRSSTTLRPPHHQSGPSISYSWPGLRTPAPTPYYARPAVATPFEDKSIMFTSKPIPPDDPATGESVSERPRPALPPRPTGPRVIIDVPKPSIMPHHHRIEKEKTTAPSGPRHPPSLSGGSTFNKSSADKTALVIGVIAVIIILIVIVAPAIVYVRVRYRPAVPKSIDNRHNYQFNSVSGTPHILTANPVGSVSHLPSGPAVAVTGDFKQATLLPSKKDLKEWYV